MFRRLQLISPDLWNRFTTLSISQQHDVLRRGFRAAQLLWNHVPVEFQKMLNAYLNEAPIEGSDISQLREIADKLDLKYLQQHRKTQFAPEMDWLDMFYMANGMFALLCALGKGRSDGLDEAVYELCNSLSPEMRQPVIKELNVAVSLQSNQ